MSFNSHSAQGICGTSTGLQLQQYTEWDDKAKLINFGLFQLSAIPGMKQLTTRTVYLGKEQFILGKNGLSW